MIFIDLKIFFENMASIIGRPQDSNIKSSNLFLLFVVAAVRRKMSEREKYVETYCFGNLDIDLNLFSWEI